MILVTILFSLLIVQVTRRRVDTFFNLFGYFVCGWFGMNATTDFLIISTHPLKVYQKKVKLHSLWWLKASKATFVYGYQKWWSDPMLCLGIDATDLL
jgi:hypothetical protein